MRAEKVGADSVLSRIVQMVGEAQRSRAPIQRMADRVSSWFVPAVVLAAATAFGVWMACGPGIFLCAGGGGDGADYRLSVRAGTGDADVDHGGCGTRGVAGVLVKNAEALETLEQVDTLVIDKTGTLTEGRPAVTAIITAEGIAESDLLRLCAGVEQASEHPLAAAIVEQARQRGLPLPAVSGFDSPSGKGALGIVEGKKVALGNLRRG